MCPRRRNYFAIGMATRRPASLRDLNRNELAERGPGSNSRSGPQFVAEIELRRGIAPDDGEAKSVRLVARTSAFVFEVVGTFLFLVTILGVTHPLAPKGFGGLAIGLTLVVIHLVGINITGTSVSGRR
jgi:hypothetical protein